MLTVDHDTFLTRLAAYRSTRPKPWIMMCGGTGVGKTTTINSLFDRTVGVVGQLSRGTDDMARYKWGTRGRHLELVDTPGLGDSKEHDGMTKARYRRWVPRVHSFIVVATPPRPAALPTLRTVKLLLREGVEPGRIVFGLNRLTALTVEVDHGLVEMCEFDMNGPVRPEFQGAIEVARRQFLETLRDGIGSPFFTLDQVIPYDAQLRWNMYQLFHRAVDAAARA